MNECARSSRHPAVTAEHAVGSCAFSEVVHAHFTDEGPHAPQIFPRHCEENEALIDEEFAAADTDGSGKISFAEFVAYYERLKVHLLIDA